MISGRVLEKTSWGILVSNNEALALAQVIHLLAIYCRISRGIPFSVIQFHHPAS